jgi:outer membrane protein assembly factor BamD (BamD/ComL family)
MSTTTAAPKKPHAPAAAETDVDYLAWLRAHQKLVLFVGGAIVVLALGTWLVMETKTRREQQAAVQLDQARNIAESGNLPLAASQLQKIIETFDGTNAATEAVVTLNQVRMVNGQTELAIVGLQGYLKTNPAKVYRVPAQGLLGEALENAGRPAEAAEAYRGAAADADVDYLKSQYLLFAARAYRNAGKPADAVKALQEILDKYPKASSATEAKVRLSELTQGQMVLTK